MSDVLRVGMLGCGNVGAAVVRLLHDHAADIERRAGARIEIARVAVRDPSKKRDASPLPNLVKEPDDVVTAFDVDVVLELIGGIEPARTLVLRAMASGKSVVTANKALLAEHGPELFDEAVRRHVDLLYEAAVGGGIPVIRSIREHLAGDRVLRLTAILNGTTNYILTRMTEAGSTLEDAAREAQAMGYAEADPEADVGGRGPDRAGARTGGGGVHHHGRARRARCGEPRSAPPADRRSGGRALPAARGGRPPRRPRRRRPRLRPPPGVDPTGMAGGI